MMGAYFLIAFLATILAVMPFLFAYRTHDGFHVRVRRLFGAKAIHIKGVGSAIRGECWTAILEEDPFGVVHAFRYPASRIGHVTIKDDGTGEYCGPIIWKPA